MTTLEARPKKDNTAGLLGKIFGYGMVAVILGFGVSLWKPFVGALGLPLIIILAVWWLMGEFVRPSLKPYIPVLAIQAGHMIFFIVSGIASDRIAQLAPDIILMTVWVIWLAIRPGRIVIICTIAYQTISILLSIWRLASVPDAGYAIVCAGISTLILRCLAIWFLVAAWKYYCQKEPVPAIQDAVAKSKSNIIANETE
jgi:hypothetical protein